MVQKQVFTPRSLVESMNELMLQDSFSRDELFRMQHFVQMNLFKYDFYEEIGDTYAGFLLGLDADEKEDVQLLLVKLLTRIGVVCAPLSLDVIEVFESLIAEGESDVILHRVIQGLGEIGCLYPFSSDRVVYVLNRFYSPDLEETLLMDLVEALYVIGRRSGDKTEVVTPLMSIAQHGSDSLKIRAIRAIKTQLDGYHGLALRLLEDIVLYESDVAVRSAAAVALGDVGQYRSYDVRRRVLELISQMDDQLGNMKAELSRFSRKKLDGAHIFYRVQDGIRVIRVLYHYMKLYEKNRRL